MTKDSQSFIDKIAPAAVLDMEKSGILASLTIAQAILESGWGKSELARKANNYFGIKGAYNGKSYIIRTQEYINGEWKTILAKFREYPSVAESIADHSDFLQAPRYRKVRGEKDFRRACLYIKEAGYATAPNYAQSLIKLIEDNQLYKFDATTAGIPHENSGTAVICLDPGHCDKFPGAGKGNQREERDVLALALKVRDYLESWGHKVVMTRTSGEPVNPASSNADLYERPKIANKSNADYFISLHRNSFGNGSAFGNEIWILKAASARTEAIARTILDEVNKVAPTKNRGVKRGYAGGMGDYAVNRLSNMASALLELGFISNDSDNRNFNANVNAYAEAVAKGICKGLGISTGSPDQKGKYNIEVGAFSSLSRAREAQKKISALGYFCKILEE